MANKTKRISIYVEPSEHKLIGKSAKGHGESVSDFGRRVILGHIYEENGLPSLSNRLPKPMPSGD